MGDFVLVSNADAAEPDTLEGCDAAQILVLYENVEKKEDPYRAKVQWFCKPTDLPNWCINKLSEINFADNEVINNNYMFNNIWNNLLMWIL